MAKKGSGLILLAIFLVRMACADSFANEKTYDDPQTSNIELSEAQDGKFHEYCEQNYFAHFFNGSYTAQDVLEELLSNKTLTNSVLHKEK